MRYFKIILTSLMAIGFIIFFMPNKLSKSTSVDECLGFKINHVCFGTANDGDASTLQRKVDFWKSKNKFCGAEGMQVPTMATKCCAGLSEMWSGCPENDCDCKFPSLGGIGICSNCGNGICERDNGEDFCNCPADCNPLK